MAFLNKKSDFLKDTSFNVGTHNITIDIKVDSDEFSLGREKVCMSMWKKCVMWNCPIDN